MNPPAPSTGKSWPLFVLAGLSLIPLLGVLFGFIAACWGLVTDRPRGLLAAAFGGGGAILNVAVVAIIGFSVLQQNPMFKGIAGGIARMELDSLVAHLDAYRAEHGRFPSALSDLPPPGGPGRALPMIDHSISLLNMTTPYEYRPSRDGQQYDLIGAGADGIADTADDVLPTSRRATRDSLPGEDDDGAHVEE